MNRGIRPDPFHTEYDPVTRELVTTTPEGRTVTAVLVTAGRVKSLALGDLEPQELNYDSRGRLFELLQGNRGWRYLYDDSGRVATIKDTLARTSGFRYDRADRVIRQTRPDNQAIGFDYDASGNLTGLRPPGKPVHGFSHTPVDLTSQYTPPTVSGGGATSYGYDYDRRLEAVTRPDDLDLTLYYESGTGRLDRIVHSRGENAFGYHSNSGYLASVTSPDTVTVNYAYDGPLPRNESWSGKVAGLVRRSYNTDFLPESLRVWTTSDGHSVVHDYDDDGLLTEVASPEGTLTIARRASDGLVSGTTLGNVTTVQDYTSYGELKLYAARFNTDTLYRASYDRDALGRITAWHEREGSTLRSREFVYDDAGRLWQVWDRQASPDTLIARYRYDLNGNRLAVARAAGDSVVATYDDQDRLLTHGSSSFSYTASGFLAQSVTGSDTTRYTYDALGNLIRVATPADTVEYRVDGLNRRVTRTANGVTTRWLWEDGLRPAAEIDGSGGIVARYVYGLQVNVPEYIARGDTAYRVITDHLGSARLLVNSATGAIVERVDYDAWGVVQGPARAGVMTFGFAGGMTDSLTGLVRFGARDYSPHLARWIVKDAIRFAGGTPNLYEYTYTTPINLIDYDGLQPAWPDLDGVEDLLGSVDPESMLDFVEAWGFADALRSSLHDRYPGSKEANKIRRHEIASELVACHYGTGLARMMGYVNEAQGLLLLDVPRLVPRAKGQQPWAFDPRDLARNERGFKRAEQRKRGYK